MPSSILIHNTKEIKNQQSKMIFWSFKKQVCISHTCVCGFAVSHLAYVRYST